MPLVVAVLLATATGDARPHAAETADGAPSYVGSAACVGCHASEAAAWRGSHHARAMQEAMDVTVLGDFASTTVAHAGVTSAFFRRDGRYWVSTDGPDGRPADFEIRYTFGVYPLQQYLIGFPDGRLQAFGVAWDARPKEAGGQHWFHLYPADLPPGSPLHWTGRDQNWNSMCAECHSTGVRRNYDPVADRFATRWAEISVGCEACHGPGSAHLAWADRRPTSGAAANAGDDGLSAHFTERDDVYWTVDPATGNAARSRPRTSAVELETCGMCHARRGQLAEPWRPGRQLLDTHMPRLLEPGLFEADGKMAGEVFEYAPFRQSRMSAAGVTCGDCHDPHGGRLRAEGNTVCEQCHAAERYDAAAHHRHAKGSPATRCAACHMPERTFMVVDRRHDHGFRVPRPDLSARFGVTNACNDCHGDRAAAWAAEAVERWFGPRRLGSQTWTEAFDAAWRELPRAGELLLPFATGPAVPGIAQASALEALAPYVTGKRFAAVAPTLADPDPLVRVGALRALRQLPAETRWSLANLRLDDPVRGVRIEAAVLLGDVPPGRLAGPDRARLERALGEYEAAERLNADRPEARAALGELLSMRGREAEARREYEAAVRLGPDYAPAYVGLADQLGRVGLDGDAERVLRQGLARAADEALLRHALGLALVRQDRTDAAIPELARAAELEPGDPRFAYVYAAALHAVGRWQEALRVLEANHARHRADRATLAALAGVSQEHGDHGAARAWAAELAALDAAAQAPPEAVP